MAAAAPAPANKSGAPKPGEVRLTRADLPQHDRRNVLKAVQVLYKRIVLCEDEKSGKKRSKMDRWGEFARALRGSMDQSFGPQWHCIIGDKIAFACKKRNKTMAVFRVDEIIIVLWCSPGIEEVGGDEGSATENGDVQAEVQKDAGGSDMPQLKVLQPSAADVSSDSEVERTVAVLRKEFQGLPDNKPPELQSFVQAVRKRLTAELGTIWHVSAGNDFVVEPAHNVRNLVHAAWGKVHVVCFQHEQKLKNTVDYQKIMKALPYLALVIFCFAYMTNQSLCGETLPDNDFALAIRRKLCGEDTEWNINAIGIIALVSLFASKKSHLFMGKSKLA